MTPKEKAEELMKNLRSFTWYTYPRAKKLSLMIVAEILELDVWDSPHNAGYGKLFWMETQKELIKI